MTTEPNTKRCAKCGATKQLNEFYKSSKAKDGLQSYCKECASKATRSGYKQITDKLLMLSTPSAENPLSNYTPRALMKELRRHGFDGDLLYVRKEVIRISLSKL